MPSQFQAVVDVFHTQQIENPGARTPLMNYPTSRLGGIFARAGKRTIDTADNVEHALGAVVGNARKAVHCIEDAVSDISEGLISAALTAGQKIAGMVKGELTAMKDGLESWVKDTFGGSASALKKWYDDHVAPKVKALKDWLLEKKKEASDMMIETMEMISAGYNNVLHMIDALAYHAEEMSGVMRKTVCGMVAGVSDMAQSGLDYLGFKKREEVQVHMSNLLNDTRSMKASVVLNNVQASVVAGHCPVPLPPDVPGANAANAVMSHAQRASMEAQIAASRFGAAHSDKLLASVTGQASLLLVAGLPAERDTIAGRPSAMPPVDTLKAAQMQAQINVLASQATTDTGNIPSSMTTTLKPIQMRSQEAAIRQQRTLPPKPAKASAQDLDTMANSFRKNLGLAPQSTDTSFVNKVEPGKIGW